jgi:hypothetical protein
MPVVRSVATLPQDTLTSSQWSKLEYNKWYADNVQNKYKIGDLLTSGHVPVKLGIAPFFWFEVTYLEETYSTAKFHDYIKEPTVIHTEVMPRTKPRTYRKHCPASLRHLTMEEKQLVYLQNTEPQGSA